jgi:hypothetical protein
MHQLRDTLMMKIFISPILVLAFLNCQQTANARLAQECAAVGEKSQVCGGNWKTPESCCAPVENPQCNGQECAGTPGNDCPATVKVSCVTWAFTGGKQGNHLHALVSVQDENDRPVNGAVVDVELKQDSSVVYTGSGTTAAGGPSSYTELEECPGADPLSGATPAFCLNKADHGYYVAVVTNVTKPNCPYKWDEVSPTNYCDYDASRTCN